MKLLTFIASLLLMLGTGWSHSNIESDNTDQPGKFALVFAIGDYPESTGWSSINAGNDIPLIVGALKKQGFSEHNINVVKDSEATKEGIKKAFEKHLLHNEKIKQGDVVFVHFSSHGQQIIDNNSDEVDGFDEAIVAYNANLTYVPGEYEGENHLRDDEIGKLFKEVRKKLGKNGNLLALIDACHSGTATRGISKARGTELKMAPKNYSPEKKVASRGESTRGQMAFMEAGYEDAAELAPMVTISGASADELNYETKDEHGKGVGSLSYAFSKVMTDAKEQMTYRELFDRIKVEMQKRVPNQTPQIEGTIDQQLFGGAVVESKPYFLPSYWEDDRTVYLESGTLQGLFDSSRVAFFDLGAQDLEKADTLNTGFVTEAGLTESYILLDRPVPEDQRSDLKVVVTSKNYGSLKVDVKLDLTIGEEAEGILEKAIKLSNAASIVEHDDPELLITDKAVSRSGAIGLYTEYDQEISAVRIGAAGTSSMEQAAARVVNEIKKFAQGRFLRTLDLEDSRRAVDFTIIPVTVKKVSRNNYEVDQRMDLSDFRDQDGNIVLGDRQPFKIQVTNHGYRKAYFTILDFTPDGKVSLMIPLGNSDMSASDYVIEPGDTIELNPIFVTEPPFGNEMFKLIATEYPLDLTPILDPIKPSTKSRSGRGPRNPFQEILQDAASATRSATLSMGSSSAHTTTISIKVVAK